MPVVLSLHMLKQYASTMNTLAQLPKTNARAQRIHCEARKKYGNSIPHDSGHANASTLGKFDNGILLDGHEVDILQNGCRGFLSTDGLRLRIVERNYAREGFPFQ